MRAPRLFGFGRVWDYLLDSWKVRFAKLGFGSATPLSSHRTQLQFASLEDRVVPARPLPLPMIFAGVGSGSPPEVKAYNAETGALIYTRTPFGAGFTGGVLVASGDLNRDGLPDVVAAAGPGGGPRVVAYSGKTGGVLRDFFAYDPSFSGGVSVAMGDVNGDGITDIITAAGAGGGPHVKVFSGVNNELLASFYAFAPGFSGGVTVAAADFTGDGKADLVVGAGAGGGPHVKVFDVSQGKEAPAPIGSFFAFESNYSGGITVGTDYLTGDITGDGQADIVVGRGSGSASQVRVFDGKSAKIVSDFSPFGSGMTKGVTVGTAFINDDKYADIVVGTQKGTVSTVKVFDGQNSKELATPMSPYTPFGSSHTGGVFVAATNDPPPIGTGASVRINSNPVSIPATNTAFEVSAAVVGDGVTAPTGSVQWYAIPSATGTPISLGTTTLGAGANNSGLATVSVPGGLPTVDTYSFQANYLGDALYSPINASVQLPVAERREQPNSCATCDGALGQTEAPGVFNSGGVAKLKSGSDDRGVIQVQLMRKLVGEPDGGTLASGVSWSNAERYATQEAGGGTSIDNRLWFAPSGQGDGSVSLVNCSGGSITFGDPGSLSRVATPVGQYGTSLQVELDATTFEYLVEDGGGNRSLFYDLSTNNPAGRRGKWKSTTDAAGNTVSVLGWDASDRPTGQEKLIAATGQVERVEYTYNAGGQIDSIIRKRKPSGGSFSIIRKSVLTYATPSGGTTPALVGTRDEDASANNLGESFNRYYGSGSSTGYTGALKFHLGAEATARAKQAFPSVALDTLSDAQLAPYADNYLEYDAFQRVSKSVTAGAGCSACSGGLGTSILQYAVNQYYQAPTTPGADVSNHWRTKVTETLDDGTVNIKYANASGQTMLSVVKEPGVNGRQWLSFTRYNSDGQVAFTTDSSGLNGYSETKDDLVDYISGGGSNALYLNDTTGLFTNYTYGTTTSAMDSSAGDVQGVLKTVSIQRGETNPFVVQSDTTYMTRTTGTKGTPSYYQTWKVSGATQYRNDNGTGAQTTSYAYSWQGSTQQPAQVTVTRPTVTTAQNGPNTAVTATSVMDSLGRVIWSKDAIGVLSYTAYDTATGSVIKTISDVDTTQTTTFANLPSGWTTPTGIGAGKHLTTTYEVDSLGRTTKMVDPLGLISYMVYNDITKESRTYSGWNTTTNLPTGPTLVSRTDWTNNYSESLSMSVTPTVASGRPTGTEAVSSIQTLSRSYRNAVGQTVYSDAYFNLSGLTYSTAANIGTQNTNFYRSTQAYNKQGMPNKTVSAAGTITRTERDSLNREISIWMGTDDTPTTGFWSTTNLAGTDMVKVSEKEYDNGVAGDGNLTKSTLFPGGSAAPRVTAYWYDWRNRGVATKAGAEAVPANESVSLNRPISYVQYDNLGQTVASEMYDGDTVTLSDGNSDGIPDRPTSSLLRAKSVANFDEWGRAYKNETFAVEPNGVNAGTVSTSALTSQTWFDQRGLTIKSSAPGGLVQKTAYDTLGRATTQYVSDGGADTTYAHAGTVVGDLVLSQQEMTYDNDGNVLMTTSRERFHDALATETAALGTSTSATPVAKARVSYQTAYYDLGNRLTMSVNVGTNNNAAYSRPTSPMPTRSDTVLINSVEYDAAGRRWKTFDPKNLQSQAIYDALGRTTKTIQNYVDGTPSNLDDKTTEYAYGPAGMNSLTAKTSATAGQTTEYVYGVTTAGGHGINSNDIVGVTKWPDPSTGASSTSQQETVLVNALGQPLVMTDRNGNTHTLAYDLVGRVVSDTVTTLGANVDGAVRRTETAYDTQGNPYLLTSYDATTGGNIVNQVQREYNGLGQLTREYQSVSGAVNTGTTPSVQYAYSALDATNRSRLVSMTYPNGRVLTYNYATGINSNISRLSSITDGATTLESYQYLGLGTVVTRAHPQPNVELSYVRTGSTGEMYTGLDNFGRILQQRWRTGTTDKNRNDYTYDRNSNRLTKTNTLQTTLNEVYTYDGLNQLASFNRNVGARTQNFGYDAVGNWNTVTTNGVTQTRAANMQNEYTSVSGATSPTYDPNGNMTTDETGKQYVYDAWNRLKQVKSSVGSGSTTLATYQYDARNYRVAEVVGANTRSLYYSSNWQVLEERVNGTARVSNVWSPVYVDAMVCRDRDSNNDGSLEERLYPTHDANFNVTALLNSAGTVVEKYAYDPYGVVTIYNASNTVLGSSAYGWQHFHQGGRLSAESGLYHFRNREYSATLGRWVTMDPIRYASRDTNLYRYESDSPIARLDQLGLADSASWWKTYCGCETGTGLPSGIDVDHFYDRDFKDKWETKDDKMKGDFKWDDSANKCGLVDKVNRSIGSITNSISGKIQWPSAKTGAEYAKWWKDNVVACKLEVYGKYYMCPDGDPAALGKAKNPRDNCFETAKKVRDLYDADVKKDPNLLKTLRDKFLTCLVNKKVLKADDIKGFVFGDGIHNDTDDGKDMIDTTVKFPEDKK
jgi:RHS repeat-associated protein